MDVIRKGEVATKEVFSIRMIFDEQLMHDIVKWSFTWVLAFLGVILLTMKHIMIDGHVNFAEMSSRGELFLVSIVIVSEPLGSLVNSGKAIIQNTTSLLFSLLIIVSLVVSSYNFCIIELNRGKIDHCIKEMYSFDTLSQRQVDCQSCNTNCTKHLYNKHFTCNTVLTVITKKPRIPDEFIYRIRQASFYNVIWCLLLGLLTILHIRVRKVKRHLTEKKSSFVK